MDYLSISNDIAKYVSGIMNKAHFPELTYHNIQHTEYVVAAGKIMAEYYQLNDADTFTLTAACWFHDIGYYQGITIGHELAGSEMARIFLSETGASSAVIENIQSCIMATAMPQQPKLLLEMIICDADLFHFSSAEFQTLSNHLRKEVELLFHKAITDSQWVATTIQLFENHQYHTGYCQLYRNEKKHENLVAMRKLVS